MAGLQNSTKRLAFDKSRCIINMAQDDGHEEKTMDIKEEIQYKIEHMKDDFFLFRG